LTEELQKEVDEVLDKSNQEEADFMVHNLEKTLDNIEKKRVEKKVKEIAINAIKMGMDNEVIIKLTGLTDEKINEIRKERSH
jgi:hypothetical protein